MRKAFTITELLVAMGLLAAVLLASGTIFSYSLQAQRQAMATAEVMRTLRAIVDQLNSDFAGWYEDSPIVVEFYKATNGSDEVRADSIAFFSAGQFETTNSYSGNIVNGNFARIYYGQAQVPTFDSTVQDDREIKILARRQTILGADPLLPIQLVTEAEYDSGSLLDQQKEFRGGKTVTTGKWLTRPAVDPSINNEYPMYFAAGVDDFTIEIEDGIDGITGEIIWWPDDAEVSSNITYWWGEILPPFAVFPIVTFPTDTANIDAIKFSFTIYDSQGIFKNGRRFEHIVYIKK
ncbi:MAG: type II secretion system GspH family protein [Anaerohalosphaeraceae bacterium]|nr:type II secretion system GspH family protein [Anaerohalosphaeraceae bacterium]